MILVMAKCPLMRFIFSLLLFPLLLFPFLQYKPQDSVLKMREFLYTLNDYGLVNENLSARRILEILSCDDPAVYDSKDCNLELEVSLEFK